MKQQVICLVAVMCLNIHSIYAMENVEGLLEYFKNLSCSELDRESDKQAWLDANPFLKKLAETVTKQEKEDLLLLMLLDDFGIDNPWSEHRKAIACALAIGAHPDIDLGLGYSKTALSKALEHDDYYLAEFALKCGADANLVSCWQSKPTRFSTRMIPLVVPLFYVRTKEMLALLIEHKADVSFMNYDKSTILHELASEDDVSSPADLIPFLVQQRCDVNARDDEGKTPIMYAVDCGHRSIFNETKFRSLLEAGTDVTIKNDDGETVFDIARKKACLKQVQEVYDQLQ